MEYSLKDQEYPPSDIAENNALVPWPIAQIGSETKITAYHKGDFDQHSSWS